VKLNSLIYCTQMEVKAVIYSKEGKVHLLLWRVDLL